jgi:hypothetical protein
VRPSGTEDLYKIYAESLRSEDRLRCVPLLITDSYLGTSGCVHSVGCALHEFDFLRRQAVEPIHQLVQLPLQRAHVRTGVALL